jgi:hypothetical protein
MEAMGGDINPVRHIPNLRTRPLVTEPPKEPTPSAKLRPELKEAPHRARVGHRYPRRRQPRPGDRPDDRVTRAISIDHL